MIYQIGMASFNMSSHLQLDWYFSDDLLPLFKLFSLRFDVQNIW